LWQLQLQLFAVAIFKHSRKAQFAVFCHGVNQRLAFRINKKGISLRGISAGALRRINGDLPRDKTAIEQGSCNLGKLFISDRHSRDHTFVLVLLDHFKVGRHLLRRKRQHLLNLDPNHFWKLRRIDARHAKPLGEHGSNRQAEDKIVGC
jgi:hypothetical protein